MKKIGRNAGKNAGGLAQLVTRFGNEITQVVQDIHGAIANPFHLRGHDYTPAHGLRLGSLRFSPSRQCGQHG